MPVPERANLCCGHLACQRIVSDVWEAAYKAGLDDAHDNLLGLASGRPNPYLEEEE